MGMDYLIELKGLGYVALAMLLGASIGYEREMADKPATGLVWFALS